MQLMYVCNDNHFDQVRVRVRARVRARVRVKG